MSNFTITPRPWWTDTVTGFMLGGAAAILAGLGVGLAAVIFLLQALFG